ncbi:MAG: endonuclease MutS2 [Clostridia bacterium]|nr:endonuclease MutS2 [Clostridia bacterium]
MNNNFMRLEYDKILNILGGYCKTYKGRELVKKLLPSFKFDEVDLLLKETNEATNIILKNGGLPLYEIKDISVWLKFLNSNEPLTISALIDLNNVLKTAHSLKRYYNDNKDGDSILKEYFFNLYANLDIEKKFSDCIINEDTISDTASKKLCTIRKNKTATSLKIKDTLNHFIHSNTYSKYLMESLITIRNNRYVIPVKSEYKGMIKGFTHDISASGSTIFIEPLQVFELNNTLNTLVLEENIEIDNILRNLSLLFRDYMTQLRNNVELIGKLDFIFAKAKLGIDTNSSCPILNKEKFLDLNQARHPLLPNEKVVPIDFNIGKDFTSLIITGPNTGGKTVSLKTIGLLCLMAYSGLLIPVKEKSSLCVFDNIFADIGDEQSIQESLSTFSSHIVNIVSICEKATSNSLILVDELGSGTDPIEGSHLALSILEYFYNLGAITVSTSHFTELKNYALVTQGFKNASFEFDIENLKPTYKLLLGIPGKSNALAISAKLGLSDSIIKRASNMLTSDSIHIEDLLKSIYDTKQDIEKEKDNISKNSNQIELLRKSLENERKEFSITKNDIIEKNKLEARNILLKAKENANAIIHSINDIADKTSLKEVNKLRNDLNLKIDEMSKTDEKNSSQSVYIEKDHIQTGMTVFINSLGQKGTILSLPNKSNEVCLEVGNMKIYRNINDLSEVLGAPQKNLRNTNVSNVIKKDLKSKNLPTQLNVIGLTVDEALPIIDKYLDDCAISKVEFGKIVHGNGTGRLRTAIHSHLKKHPQVRSFRVGTFGEGEMGVTIVEIKK